jgi:hypothetical protein
MTDRVSAALSKGTAPPDSLIGRVIGGRFKITALIARGGMGKVYRAEQASLGRICAVKVLNPSYAGEHDPEFHKRFFLEASIASKLTHPNTVTIFDYGRTEDDVYYMAMEYLQGQTLHRAIREAGYLPEARVAHIARQICRALREAHAQGVIHRDLKPANIFLVQHGDEADFVKVLDFGLVKNVADRGEDLTQTGMFMGSPKYMAPEQIRGDRVDARTDIYALGIILYETLTGKVPFDRATSVNILMAHVHEEAPPMREMNPSLRVSRAMVATVAGCMAKDPARRYRSMGDVLDALKSVDGAPTAGGVQKGSAQRAAGGSARRSFGESPGAPLLPRPRDGGGSKGVLAAGVAGAIGIVAILGYAALRPVTPRGTAAAHASADPSPRSASGAEVATATVLSAAPPAVAAPSPASVRIKVETDPDGASVREDGVEVCAATPCDILYGGAAAVPGRVHNFTLARQGYRVEIRAVKAEDSPLNVKLSSVPRPTTPPAAPLPHGVDTPTVPTGYKTDIPY